MKPRIYILFILAFAFFSCTPGYIDNGEVPDNCIDLIIYNTSLSTKVSDSEVVIKDPGDENERVINKLDLFFYSSDKPDGECVMYIQKTNLGSSGKFNIPLYVQESEVDKLFPTASECTLYAIANLPDSEEFAFKGNEKVADLKAMVVTAEEFKNVVSTQGTYQAPEQFLMTGSAVVVRNQEEKISATLALKRAASKITMSFKIPASLPVKVWDIYGSPVLDPNTQEQLVEKWVPFFTNNDPTAGIQLMHMGMHKGINKTYIEDSEVNSNHALINASTFESGYTESFTYTGTKDGYYNYKCDITYYSYSFCWNEDENDLNAPYFTIMIPWQKDTDDESNFQTFYYLVVINGSGKELARNTWYDINLTVELLGSRVETSPIQVLEDLTYTVIDWSEGTEGSELYDDVDLHEWQYLIVPEHRVEMNNTSTGSIKFEASHAIGWVLEWPSNTQGLDELEVLYNTNKYAAYYINNRNKTPIGTQLTDINNNSFSISSSGNSLIFTHDIPENVYSPIYAHVKIWLDIDGNGRLNGDEVNFVEHVTYVQYPPIYITPSKSVEKSIFVNGYYTAINGSDSSDDIKINSNNSYNMGRIPGTSDSGDHMYVISVSKFEADDVFTLDGKTYQYLIGDPRVTTSDINLNKANYDMTQGDGKVVEGKWPKGWVLAKDVNGVERRLEHYYPTAEAGDVFRVIAPKFRVVSFMSSGYSYITPEGAKMRCASFQENGYPAGRWRLPTYAEIQYVISLQNKQVIQDIFYSSNYYYASTHLVQNSSSGSSYKDIADNSTGSVRCVYDEWYWGDNSQDANKGTINGVNGGFVFTWGDKER